MKTTSAIITLWVIVTLLPHNSAVQSGNHTVESGINATNARNRTINTQNGTVNGENGPINTANRTINGANGPNNTAIRTTSAANGTIGSGNATDLKPEQTRIFYGDIIQQMLMRRCPDPLQIYDCKECEKHCGNLNPSPYCGYGCQLTSTCICKPGTYRTFRESPKCAPPDGPIINNCKLPPNVYKG
ncbi:uncharacterized protein LOC129593030 [Paramacrobiotus metropolitanus]|uniref:uncharacterized protein LOC129593030 n=1 Tax=Paramacrobiotus metropolitanus TaxID=2943436 RepID=UPI002445F5FA|nr:uncharacterized protein LOC129593030 [Paramacrobiotus metropolitanus]